MPRPKGVTHGRESTYVHGCRRCVRCRDAARLAERIRRERKAARLRADPSLAPHGVAATYKHWGCRCVPCTTANAVAWLVNQRARQQKRNRVQTELIGSK